MTERSRPWTGEDTGDCGPYSDDQWDDIYEALFGSGGSPYEDRGVIAGWTNELEVGSTGDNNARVPTGAALVYGKFYKNTANVDVNIPNGPGGGYREDLICLQSVYASQTIRVYRHPNGADNVPYPNPTQDVGVTWEVPLAGVRVNAGGVITAINDLREYVAAGQGSIDATPNSDHTANGLKTLLTVGEGVVFGEVLYVKVDGKLWKADADADTTAPAIAMALQTKGAAEECSVLLYGFARDDTWTWTVGGDIFLSTAAGALTQTAPNGAGDQIQIVGVATHADRMFFNAQLEMVEHS